MPDENPIASLPVRPNGVPLVQNAGPRRPLAPSQHLTPSQKMAVNSMIDKLVDPLKARIAELEAKVAALTGGNTPPEKPASAPAAAKASTPAAKPATPPAGKAAAKTTPPAKPAADKPAPAPAAGKQTLPESNQEISDAAAAIIAKAKDPDLQRALTSIAKRDQPQEVTLAQMNAALQKYQPDSPK